MLKMMKNMSLKASEDKFKRIRLGNANFHSKVGGIDGGLEVSKIILWFGWGGNRQTGYTYRFFRTESRYSTVTKSRSAERTMSASVK